MKAAVISYRPGRTRAERSAARGPCRAAVAMAMLLLLALGGRAAAQPSTAPAAQMITRDLLAEGTGEHLWVATVIPSGQDDAPGERTLVRVRGQGDSTRWHALADLSARAIGTAHRGSELVVLLRGGDWKLVSAGLIRSGATFPDGAVPVEMAGDDESLWAIAAPTTAPTRPRSSTTPSATAATNGAASLAAEAPLAATHPAPLALYQMQTGRWVWQGALPRGLNRNVFPPPSLARIGRDVWIAIVESPQARPPGPIRVFQWGGSKSGWQDRGAPPLSFPPSEMRLLDLQGKPVLWVAAAAGAGAILSYGGDGTWSESRELKTSAAITSATDRAVTTAFGRLRLVYHHGTGELFEQAFDEGGNAVGNPEPIILPAAPQSSRIAQVLNLTVMVLLTWVMVIALRRRGKLQEAMRHVNDLSLAPLLPRLGAGLIDAFPLMVLPIVIGFQTPVEEWDQRYAEPIIELWLAVSLGVYLGYTTISELLFDRTLGKWLFGMRVANLEGHRPRPQAILARNLLRVIDISLLFPLAMVIFSPLRQRVGDLAAGTIVIRPAPGPAEQ